MNIGDASEIYAWMQLVLDGKITGSKADLSAWPSKSWTIRAVARMHAGRVLELSTVDESVVFMIDGVTIENAPKARVQEFCSSLHQAIVSGVWKDKQTAARLGEKIQQDAKTLFSQIHLNGAQGKADLLATVEEPIQHFIRVARRGLSVKSTSGSPPTLVNASRQSRFRFDVRCPAATRDAAEVSSLVRELNHEGLRFRDVRSPSYEDNLAIVDSQLAEMLAWMMVERFATMTHSVTILCDRITQVNPLKLRTTETYRRKVGEFLVASALGMIPSEPWNGVYQADGGLMVVKKNGDLVTFFIVDEALKQEFSKFLLNTTYLETASTSRHDFGKLYLGDNMERLDLALQVRLEI